MSSFAQTRQKLTLSLSVTTFAVWSLRLRISEIVYIANNMLLFFVVAVFWGFFFLFFCCLFFSSTYFTEGRANLPREAIGH